jgi:hypothetical protein
MSDKDTLFPDKKAPHEVPMAPRTGGPAREEGGGGGALRPQEGPGRTPGRSDDPAIVPTEHTQQPYPGVKVT